MSTGGHRALPHTADIRIEAWAPTREECIGEAVAGLADAFVSVPDDVRVSPVPASLSADTDEDALVAVLDEVIYLMETSDAVAIRADVTAAAGDVHVTFAPSRSTASSSSARCPRPSPCTASASRTGRTPGPAPWWSTSDTGGPAFFTWRRSTSHGAACPEPVRTGHLFELRHVKSRGAM